MVDRRSGHFFTSCRSPVAHLALMSQMHWLYWHEFSKTSIRSIRSFHVRSGTPSNFLPWVKSFRSYHFVFTNLIQPFKRQLVADFSTGVAFKSPGGVGGPFGCSPVVTWLRRCHWRSTGNRKKTYQSISKQLAKSWIHQILLSNWKHSNPLDKFRAPKEIEFFKWNNYEKCREQHDGFLNAFQVHSWPWMNRVISGAKDADIRPERAVRVS